MSIAPLKAVKLFVASGSDLKDERRDTKLVLIRVGKYFPSLKLEPVMWETDIPSGSCYDKNRIQEEINPLLDDCDLVLVIFYSKTGRFTLEEYQLARQKNKKIFLYFKTGFSTTKKQENKDYEKVLDFREELEKENTLIFKEYKTLDRFREILKDDLTLYLKQRYSSFGTEETVPLHNLRKILYRGSRDYYDALRGPNGRFRFLKISDIILPDSRGQWMETNVKVDQEYVEDGGSPDRTGQIILEALPGLWDREIKHSVIVGAGGMGKTVSLLHWWEKLLEPGDPVKPIPVFIALNELNQVKEGKRENFILSRILENYGQKSLTPDQVKKIMKTPAGTEDNFVPSMVLLLDGFNEITVEKKQLLLELKYLTEQFPGVQVVITSRYDMRKNFNWGHWHPVKLMELEKDRVEEYLSENSINIPRHERLLALIRNPMMLTLYAAACEVQKIHGQSIHCSFKEPVETPGELLWNFMEVQVARLPERLAEDEKKIAYYKFLLKFFLPGLGYEMEKAGLFDFSEQQLYDCMELLCRRFGRDDFFNTYTQFYELGRELPVGDCADSMARRERGAKLQKILCGELSMLVGEGESFRFLHQHFRDFFAAVHILNELEMGKNQGETAVLKERRLDFNIRRLLGELEGEYRSKPYLTDREWRIDIDKENRLYTALEGMRGKFGAEVGYGVWNIVETWKEVRGELSGADLSGLDLSGVMLNGVYCSRSYHDGYLATCFKGARVHERNLFFWGHSDLVTSAVYSWDGKKILSASYDLTIKEWDAETGECVKTLAGHSDSVTSAVYSWDGKKILSASYDQTIKEWDADTGACVKTLVGHSNWVSNAVYSRDGEKILSASYDQTIKEWDADTGACVKTLAGHSGGVTSAMYSWDGEKILSASVDGTIKEWDAETGECVKTLAGHTFWVNSAVYSRDGKKILSAFADKTIKEWEVDTGACVKILAGHYSSVTSAVYSRDEKKILSASDDGTIKEWDAETGECVKTLARNSDLVTSAVYSWDGEKILSASRDKTIKEWDAETGECVKTLAGHSLFVSSAVYSRDGKKILSASSDQTIKEWDAETGECLQTWKRDEKPVLDEYAPGDNENIKLRTYGYKIEIKGKVIFNIPGLFIQGCSFKDLEQGSRISPENLEILKQYGARFK